MPLTTLKPFAGRGRAHRVVERDDDVGLGPRELRRRDQPAEAAWMPRIGVKMPGAVLRLVEVLGEVDVVARDVQRVERAGRAPRTCPAAAQNSFWSGVSVDGAAHCVAVGKSPESVQSPVMQCLITSENLMSFAPVEISTASGIARADEVVQLVELRLRAACDPPARCRRTARGCRRARRGPLTENVNEPLWLFVQ